MKRRWRELALAATIAALMLAFSVQLRRVEPLPRLPPMMAVVVPAPPLTAGCSAIGFPGKPPRKIVDVQPIYPPAARRAPYTDVVIVQADIDEHGHVAAAHVVRSVPLLDLLALDAVLKWQFEPAMLRGDPACVTTTLAVEFPPQ
jgi:TonB family protein